MKKFFVCLIILAIFGTFVFFVGWTSIRVKPEQVGVVISKTGGVSEIPVENGKFVWHKEFLLPTNAVLKCYSLEPVTVKKQVSGSLASGEIYSAVLNSSNNFSYDFSYSLSLSITAEDLIALIKANKVKSQEDLTAYMETAGDIFAQLITDYILKKAEENPRFQVESIRRDDLTRAIRIYLECPEVELSLFAITSSKLPDYDLYKKVKSQVFTTEINRGYTPQAQIIQQENTENNSDLQIADQE